MVLALLFIAHLFGDFLFQPSKMVEGKKTKLFILLLHTAIYAVCFLVILMLCIQSDVIWYTLIVLSASHFIIDFLRVKVFKVGKEEHKKELYLFLCDQALHIAIIVSLYYLFELSSHMGSLLNFYIGKYTYEPVKEVVLIALIYAIALNPTAVLVNKVLKSVVNGKSLRVKNEADDGEDKNKGIDKSGYLIGIFERVITITFILISQLGAIGFVLAAKSLARFRQLEEQNFAEKYLVGTLLSITVALCSALLIKLYM